MFDLMGAIRQRQNKLTPLRADSAETAETAQQRACTAAETLRETADQLTDTKLSATIRTNPQTQKAGISHVRLGFSDLSANPQNPQALTEEEYRGVDIMLKEIALAIGANTACLSAELDQFDMNCIAKGQIDRGNLLHYFALLRRNGKDLQTASRQPPSQGY